MPGQGLVAVPVGAGNCVTGSGHPDLVVIDAPSTTTCSAGSVAGVGGLDAEVDGIAELTDEQDGANALFLSLGLGVPGPARRQRRQRQRPRPDQPRADRFSRRQRPDHADERRGAVRDPRVRAGACRAGRRVRAARLSGCCGVERAQRAVDPVRHRPRDAGARGGHDSTQNVRWVEASMRTSLSEQFANIGPAAPTGTCPSVCTSEPGRIPPGGSTPVGSRPRRIR